MFVDGVRDFGGYSRDSFNLEQVEVAKGPVLGDRRPWIHRRRDQSGQQGAAWRPRLDVSLGGGNVDYKRSTIDINQPIESRLPGTALRLNAMWTDSGVPGRDVVEQRALGCRTLARVRRHVAEPSDHQLLHLEQDNVPEYGLPWVPANTNPELAAYSNGQPPVDSVNFYGLAAGTTRRRPRTSPRRSSTIASTPGADVAESHAFRAQRPRLRDHGAALCQRQHEH